MTRNQVGDWMCTRVHVREGGEELEGSELSVWIIWSGRIDLRLAISLIEKNINHFICNSCFRPGLQNYDSAWVVPCGTTFVCWLFSGFGWFWLGVLGWRKVGGHYGGGGPHLTTSHRKLGVFQGDKKFHLIDIFSLESSPDRGPPYETRRILTSFTPTCSHEIFLAGKNQCTTFST